jgi:hypothetical protein
MAILKSDPPKKRSQGGGGGGQRSLAGAHPSLTATTILPESGEVRFLDALVSVAVSGGTVLWTATRPANSAIGWAAFWTLLGGLMAVEGQGELRWAGIGTASANASYLALRMAQLVKVEPQVAYSSTLLTTMSGPVLSR